METLLPDSRALLESMVCEYEAEKFKHNDARSTNGHGRPQDNRQRPQYHEDRPTYHRDTIRKQEDKSKQDGSGSESDAETDRTVSSDGEPHSLAPAFGFSSIAMSIPREGMVDPSQRDQFLLDQRRRGVSYGEIKRLGGFTEAESTLRGIFRSLTKQKLERVRKPRWSEKDACWPRPRSLGWFCS